MSSRHAEDTTAAFRADTDDAQRQEPCHDELTWRIEDAAKNQTARNPEFTVLDSRETSGRRERDEDRDGES